MIFGSEQRFSVPSGCNRAPNAQPTSSPCSMKVLYLDSINTPVRTYISILIWPQSTFIQFLKGPILMNTILSKGRRVITASIIFFLGSEQRCSVPSGRNGAPYAPPTSSPCSDTQVRTYISIFIWPRSTFIQFLKGSILHCL